jgi:hypothetical protein
MPIYTAQYKYSGPDRLDITILGADPVGLHWAPTWKMVNEYKKGFYTEREYRDAYYKLLTDRWFDFKFMRATLNLVEKVKTEDVTVVCFCPANGFCHRYLLIDWLVHNWDVIYGGER